jgi:hypothetical protein
MKSAMRSLASRGRGPAVLVLGVTALSLLASAQEGTDPKQNPPAADEPPKAAPSPESLLARLEQLYAAVMDKPAAIGLDAPKEAQDAHTMKQVAWERAIKEFAKTSDAYVAAIGDAAPDARSLYFRGVAKLTAANNSPEVTDAERPAVLEAARDALTRYVEASDEKSAFLADAEMHLGHTCMLLARTDRKRADEAIPHLRRAVELLQKDGRHDEAGVAANSALAELVTTNRTAEAKQFADAVHAADGDFGGSTPTMRKFAAAVKAAVGAPMPSLPGLLDVDGNDLGLAKPDGHPVLLHFFLTSMPGVGSPMAFRDVETDVLPLWTKYKDKGLRVIGICMDYKLPDAQAERMRKNWEQWGKKGVPRDGSLEQCREWAKAQHIAWPWYWDGLWQKNPVSAAAGGVGVNAPYAILVDGQGIIRWRGESKGQTGYEGLADEVAKLVK